MLEILVDAAGNAPTLAEMPQRTLSDKGIDGPTGAHVIEQIHTPLNLAYVTFTTGSSAFQNIVGVTWQELPLKIEAAKRALLLAGIESGSQMLVTYPPLINVFTREALTLRGIEYQFLSRSNRDALLLALCKKSYQVLLGESTFLRATLEQAVTMGLSDLLPPLLCLLAAGTPLDLELLPLAERFGYSVHDLYGNQEFGWLTLDGIPLRDDLSLIPSPSQQDMVEVIVGGLPTGDSFPLAEKGHICNNEGQLLTYKRLRSYPDYEVTVTETPYYSAELIERTARTLLRIKGRIVRVAADLRLQAPATVLELSPGLPSSSPKQPSEVIKIAGPQKTMLFDSFVEAQRALQTQSKNDPTWLKRR
jgi:hypothetical protein